jgi:hypothetical protein
VLYERARSMGRAAGVVRAVPVGTCLPGLNVAGRDGRDGLGTAAPRAVYFLRLKGETGSSRQVRAVLLR